MPTQKATDLKPQQVFQSSGGHLLEGEKTKNITNIFTYTRSPLLIFEKGRQQIIVIAYFKLHKQLKRIGTLSLFIGLTS